MRPVSSAFLRAVRGSHVAKFRARLLTTFQTGINPEGIEIPILGGDVRLDANANERASLDLTTDGLGTWPTNVHAALAPFGNEVFVERGVDGLVQVPAEVQVTIRAWGAQGGGANGGLGGYAEGTFTVEGGTTLSIRVGGQGAVPTSATGQANPGHGLAGGFNGGGDGGYYYDNFLDAGILRMGGSGGGVSDVRWGGDTLADRQIVAAGGGGGSNHAAGTGGDGGGDTGQAGGTGPNQSPSPGGGGTQSAGGAGGTTGSGSNGGDGTLGQGGNGGVFVTLGNNGGGPGGGGAGYYGGGGGKSTSGFGEAGGGGGGSNFIATSATNTINQQGVRSGHGRVEIEINGNTTVFGYTGDVQTFRVTAFDTEPEWVPLGYFRIDTQEQDDAPNGPIRISGRDRMAGIVEARLLEPRQFAAGATFENIFTQLVTEVYPDAEIELDADFAVATLSKSAVVEQDRHKFLKDLATSRGKVMYFDHRGVLVVTSPPNPSVPVFDVDYGEGGVLVSLSRQLSREGVYNAVVAYGDEADFDSDEPPPRAVVVDDNPESATYYHGLFGKVPRFYISPFITTDEQASTAAAAILQQSLGLPYSVSFVAVPNPALEPLDPVRVAYGEGEEIHVIETITIPLAAEAAIEATTRTQVAFIPGELAA